MTDEEKKELVDYWSQQLSEFEECVYPVFHARGYSKNTALQVFIVDQLDSSIIHLLSKLMPQEEAS